MITELAPTAMVENPRSITPKFYDWVITQHQRDDEVGQMARRLQETRKWPRKSWRLSFLLDHAERHRSQLRISSAMVKAAHAEWRSIRSRSL